MSIIGGLKDAWNYVSGDSKPAPAPAAAPTPAAPVTTPVSNLAGASGTASSPTASANVTNAQGNAARLALGTSGSGGRVDDIPPPPPIALDWSYDSSLKTIGSTPLRPKDQATRLDDLRSISQLDENKKTLADGDRCGASSIVAGAYYAKGADGLKGLVADQQAYAKKHGLELKDPYYGDKELKKRVESGEKLTNDDINKMQENLHKTLQARDKQAGHTGIKGVHRDTMREFVTEGANTKKAFDEKGLVIAHVDTDRKDGGNHYVLSGQQPDGSSFVYDPFSIKDPKTEDLNQVVTDPNQLKVYKDSLQDMNGDRYVYSGSNVPINAN